MDENTKTITIDVTELTAAWDELKTHRTSLMTFIKSRRLKKFIENSALENESKKQLKHLIFSVWCWGVWYTKRHLANLADGLNQAFHTSLAL